MPAARPDDDSPDPVENPEPPPPPTTETDPRFPSGRWVGFWLQPPLRGRQYMNPLHLSFAAGRVTGHGSDCIGDFELNGSYNLQDGRCLIVKQYLGAHSVKYDGCNQNDGLWIWGTWEIGTRYRGGFHLWPWGQPDPTERRTATAQDAPGPEDHAPSDRRRRRVLVPSIGDE